MILQVIYMFWKNIQINFMKIRPVGADLFYAGGRGRTDRQTDRYDKANSRFSKFCEIA